MTSEQISRIVYHLLTVAILVIIAIWVYFITDISAFADLAKSNAPYAIDWDYVSAAQLYIAAGLSLVPHMCIVWGLVHLRRLFFAFSHARIFDIENPKHATRFAQSLVSFWAASFFMSVLVSVVLSWHHGAGQKVLSVQLNSQHLAVLLLGLVFWVIAKVLQQAHHLEKENNAFI